MAIKKNSKTGSAVRDLGCSIEKFKEHIESLFESGMTWDNYGRYGWHIDHIKPLSKFDLTDSDQVKVACNFKNMKPMWWQDNLSKGNKCDYNVDKLAGAARKGKGTSSTSEP